MNKEQLEDLEIKGYTILRGWVGSEWLESIQDVLPHLFREHQTIRTNNQNGIDSKGVAMNVLASSDLFISFLDHMCTRGLISSLEEGYFKTSCILNSFTALNNIQEEEGVFHKKVHRDVKIYSGDTPMLLNMLVMVDAFTEDNGGTLILPYSHHKQSKPSQIFWDNNHVPLTGNPGDIVIWNSNVFHKSGTNTTSQDRKALPITLSLPYYKQLLDYPRALGYDRKEAFSEKIQKLLGYDSIVPSSVEEWYRPKTTSY